MPSQADEPIQVECYAGAIADELPRAVVRKGRRREVVRVMERWIEEAEDPAKGRRRWYRVQFPDGETATIYCDLALDMWFLRARGTPGAGAAGNPSVTLEPE
ncbi:MAG TPA: hypothetical protein VIG69_14180 [Candidatus Methylomirabilis sp.]